MRPKKEILLSYLKDYPNNPLLLQRTFTNNNQINNSNTLSNKFLNNFKKKCTRFKIRTRNNYICSSSKLLRDKDKKNNSRNNNNTYSNSRNYNNSRVINIINSKWWDNYLGEWTQGIPINSAGIILMMTTKSKELFPVLIWISGIRMDISKTILE